MKIRIYDNNFSHISHSCHGRTTDKITWDREIYHSDICFFTDNLLQYARYDNSKIKVAWLIEPRAINPQVYSWISKNHNLFSYILTHNVDLINLNPEKFFFIPSSGCWIEDKDIYLHDKNKLISIIASSKNITKGHTLRHQIVKKFGNVVSVYGRGYFPIENKIEGLRDYMFSIVIENSKVDHYFTEKIIDSFAAATIPIYWGTKSVNKIFDSNGIIHFDNLENLNYILDNISKELYKEKIQSVKNNLSKIEKYKMSEHLIYDFIKKIILKQ